jgi:hypothetical protein
MLTFHENAGLIIVSMKHFAALGRRRKMVALYFFFF